MKFFIYFQIHFVDAVFLFWKPRRNAIVFFKIFNIIIVCGGYKWWWRDAGFSGRGSSCYGRRPGHPPTRVP
jgi:hypothetical protein